MAHVKSHDGASPFRTIFEVSDYLKLSERQVRRLVALGQIKATRFGRAVRVHNAILMPLSAHRSCEVSNETSSENLSFTVISSN